MWAVGSKIMCKAQRSIGRNNLKNDNDKNTWSIVCNVREYGRCEGQTMKGLNSFANRYRSVYSDFLSFFVLPVVRGMGSGCEENNSQVLRRAVTSGYWEMCCWYVLSCQFGNFINPIYNSFARIPMWTLNMLQWCSWSRTTIWCNLSLCTYIKIYS